MQVIRVAWKHFTFQFPNCVVKFDLQLKKKQTLGYLLSNIDILGIYLCQISGGVFITLSPITMVQWL